MQIFKYFFISSLFLVTLYGGSVIAQTTAPIKGIEDLHSLRSEAIALGADGDAVDKLFNRFLERRTKYSNKNYVTLIDYNKPSTEKRMFIFNLRDKEVKSYLVAHGKGTGNDRAKYFSNEANSNMSSLGFFKTGDPYVSAKVGYALRLHGLEQINDNAIERGIVLHGAWYVDEKVIKENGRLGRSLGCPAVDSDYANEIINELEGGSLILAYHDQLETGIFEEPAQKDKPAASSIDQAR